MPRLFVIPKALHLWVCIFALGLPGLVRAEQPLFRMVYQEFEPYSFTGTDGVPHGLAIDLMLRLAGDTGYEVDFIRAESAADAVRMVAEGEAEVSAFLAFTPERLELALPTQELGSFDMLAFVLKGHPARTLQDLSGMDVGVIANSFSATAAQRIRAAQFVDYSLIDSMLVPLLAGDVDAIVSAGDSLWARLREADVEQFIRQIETPLSTVPYGYFVTPDRPDLHAALVAAIEPVLKRKDLRVLHDIWFGRSKTLIDYALFWWVGAGGVVCLCILGFAGYRSVKYKRRSEGLLRESKANTLLVSALDEMTAAIVIYDKALRVVH